MAAALKQVPMSGLEDPAEENAEIEAGYIWREQMWSRMRAFVSQYSAGQLRGYDAAAAELDRRWGAKGRPVSASILRAALADAERNNFRLEWVDWFAARDQQIAELLGRRVKPEKTDAEMLADVLAELREELTHKRIETVMRRARAR